MALLTRLLLWLCLLAPLPAYADELTLHEPEIKAGLLYNFLKYTDWPAGRNQGMLVVCVFGSDPFEGYLKPMGGRTVNQREIALRTIHDAAEAKNCHLLFVNANEKDSWPQLQAALGGSSVLTVSDFDGFASSGGMIEFGHEDNHISANLNIDAVTAASLHVQDRLLRLVKVVHGEKP